MSFHSTFKFTGPICAHVFSDIKVLAMRKIMQCPVFNMTQLQKHSEETSNEYNEIRVLLGAAESPQKSQLDRKPHFLLQQLG